KLWSRTTKDSTSEDQLIIKKCLNTEVETLGNIRHKNIVKLYSYFSNFDCHLLVYDYMPNGNLWDALHKGWFHLDWPNRHQIALGVAQGLAYLHHDLLPPIVHRDIKSTNILLDINYQPKVADFGIAKVLKDSTSTIIAGTYGYLAPEYAFSNKAKTKCDVYSFGVVLMELITGKKPVDADFGEIAMCCTCKNPSQRPTMNEVVQLLIQTDPCLTDPYKFSTKTRDASNVTENQPEEVES
ncbi:hypothetical protein Gotri_005221, partial [Gossypium trilobum]|nr:hypothetical protein [Gossypium trilobum]